MLRGYALPGPRRSPLSTARRVGPDSVREAADKESCYRAEAASGQCPDSTNARSPTPDPLTVWLLAARDGDTAAATAFVRATEAEVRRFVVALTEPQAGDDLTQDTYLRVFRGLPNYEARAPARAWLFAIARRACAEYRRTANRLHRLDARIQAQPTWEIEPDPADLTSTSELLSDLPADRRVAFVLTQVLGMSYAEAAKIEGVPVGTIRSRVYRARSDLVQAITNARR